ncbi:hypothetical protein BVRB_3g063800 [Beta vulgaris subsp. vulgaris]|uniref:uncharacterized protein LOC104889565 n=1 Tax=Beta vulgaris subsp. vulgaris TaxID=3555 RepID=UPI00053FF099|nr:uncharacterized protein LOC104889565 [Beta vulgaris subsp. vulgaris]KMT15271.1 hypothetical protein BVRB_3g063800 [Beta vulgaris subsp. vulgaris]
MAIRADRRNYVMSVELAMQREMEFRQKLINQSSLQPQVERPTSSQVPGTIIQPASNVYLRPSHGPICGPTNTVSVPIARPPGLPPYPYPSPYSRPSPNAGPSRSADQRRNGRAPLPDGIFTCKVCQIDCKTGFNLLGHYQGQKHKARLQGGKGKEVASGKQPRENEKRPYCDLCGIWCTDEYTYRMHFNCTNHILKQYDCLMKKKGVYVA